MSMRHLLLRLFAPFTLLLPASASPPAWWADGDPPILTGTPENNKGPANIGQAKWMVAEALRALDSAAPGIATQIRSDLAGTPPDHADRIIDLTVPDPKPADWSDKQKAPLLIGQLKAIAHPFYKRLNAEAWEWVIGQIELNNAPHAVLGQNYWPIAGDASSAAGGFHPWNPATSAGANKAAATIGQLKAVFSLRLETLSSAIALGDADGDGLTNDQEALLGTSITDADTDGDGIPDGIDAAPLIPDTVPLAAASTILVWSPLE